MPLLLALLAALLFEQAASSPASSQPSPPPLDYDFYRAKVEPLFLEKRPGHARCVTCHAGSATLSRYWLSTGPYHLMKNDDGPVLANLALLNNPSLPDDKVAGIYQDIAKQIAASATLIPACAVHWTFVAKKNIMNIDKRVVLPNFRAMAIKKS